MEAKTVKISEANYRALCEYAGELQRDLGEVVSVDRALTFVLYRSKLSDLAGSWKMSDKESDEIMKDIKKGWKNWKIKSA